MKVNIKDQKQELTFPVLMKMVDSDRVVVVLFTDLTTGVCLMDSNNYFDPCFTSSNWIQCTDKEHWEKYEGTIELSND